jgi:alkanesulfonate monooxygenase SsuD/methylene tetrahydromethanopterin reductase-like flavin-dependent oxidoreductase (luciferase family)
MQDRQWDSRDDDAIIYDRERGVFADPSKVREIGFQGDVFRSRGRHFVAPSPQRRPVLWQAGSSEPGREFASKQAESVFGIFQTPKSMRPPTPTTSVPALRSTGVTSNGQ